MALCQMRSLLPAPSFCKLLESSPGFLFFIFPFLIKIKFSPLPQPCLSAFYSALNYTKIFILSLGAEQPVLLHAKSWRPPLSYPDQVFVKQKKSLTLLEKDSEANLLI